MEMNLSVEFGVAHVACFDECFVEGECVAERMGSMGVGTAGEVVTQQRTVVGMGAMLYDFMCALYWRLTTQVGYALIGDDHVTACSEWSTCDTMGTIWLIAPPLVIEGHENIER